MAAKDDAVALIRGLSSGGLSVREIAARSSGTIGKSLVHAILKGTGSISEGRAARFVSEVRAIEQGGVYEARAFNANGKPQWLDPVNKQERAKLREYLETVKQFQRGQVDASALRKFENMEVTVRDADGRKRVRLLADAESIREKARAGELDEIRFWRGRGSP